ncbi:MAG: hypothetical protein U1C50_03120 [Patescibacteria group bacterium]|nr:hypothetical protein [Patescibacteria group bacterium]
MVIFLLIIFLLFPAPAYARKQLPARSVKAVASSAALPQTSLKLRGDRQALLLVLTNLSKAESLSYLLTYQAAGVGQGVEGSHDPALGNIQKELVFGTCSGTVCTYHQDLTDMLFQATIGLKDGRTLTRKYQINI